MKKQTFLTFLFFILLIKIQAQTAEDSVKASINRFFEGMKNADTVLIKASLTEGVIFQTIARKKEGDLTIRNENVADFLKYISTQEKGRADERITFDMIKIDGALASVWTPYKFYLKDQFSHCGANSFQLVKIDGNWKINYIIDTRRKQGCE
jgi:Putative lumazine-binding